MPEVKPCFACGNDLPSDDQFVNYPHDRLAVRCPNCKTRGPWFRTEKAAVAGWNSIRRPQDPHDRDYVWVEDLDDVVAPYRKPHEADVYREGALKGVRAVLKRLSEERDDAIRRLNEAKREWLGSSDANRWGALREAFTSVLDELGVPAGEFDWSDIDDIVEAGKHAREQIDGLKDETRFKPAFRKVAKALMDYSEPPKRPQKVAGHMIDRIGKLKKRVSKPGELKERLVAALDYETPWDDDDEPTWEEVIEATGWAADHICQAPNEHDVLAEIRTTCPRVDQSDLPTFIERYRAIAFHAINSFGVEIDDPADWNSVRDKISEGANALQVIDEHVRMGDTKDFDRDSVYEALRRTTYWYDHASVMGQRWRDVCDLFGADPERPEAAFQRMRHRESVARNAADLLSELAELIDDFSGKLETD